MVNNLELDDGTVEQLETMAIQDIDPEEVASPALKRLIQDIQAATPTPNATAYNRMHNRHNRGR